MSDLFESPGIPTTYQYERSGGSLLPVQLSAFPNFAFFVNIDEEDFLDDGAALGFREAHESLLKKRVFSYSAPDNNNNDDEDEDRETSSDQPTDKLVCETSYCIKYIASESPFPSQISEPDFWSGSRFRRPTSESVHVLDAVREVHVGDSTNFMKLESGRVYIRIKSPKLIQALEAVMGGTTNTLASSSTSQIMQIEEPYKIVVDHLDELRNYGQTYAFETGLDITLKHIKVLLRYIDKAIGNDLRAEMRLKELTPPMVTFNWLWTIFRNDVTLYARSTDQAYELEMISGGPLAQWSRAGGYLREERI
jgi:hypothetical protein